MPNHLGYSEPQLAVDLARAKLREARSNHLDVFATCRAEGWQRSDPPPKKLTASRVELVLAERDVTEAIEAARPFTLT